VTAYDDQVLALSPDGYWKLDEASGLTFVDSSTGGHDLVAGAGAVERYQIPGPSRQEIPYALDFLNVNPPAPASGTVGQRAIGASFSVEAWFGAVGSIPSAFGILQKGYNVTEQRPWYSLGVDTTGFPHWWFRNSGGTDYKLTGVTPLNDASYAARGPFHHVVGTYTSGTADLYVDGRREAQLAVPNTGWGTGAQPLSLGVLASSVWGGPWLAAVAIYPGQLSAAQVQSNFELGITGNAFTPTQLADLIAQLSLDLTEIRDAVIQRKTTPGQVPF